MFIRIQNPNKNLSISLQYFDESLYRDSLVNGKAGILHLESPISRASMTYDSGWETEGLIMSPLSM